MLWRDIRECLRVMVWMQRWRHLVAMIRQKLKRFSPISKPTIWLKNASVNLFKAKIDWISVQASHRIDWEVFRAYLKMFRGCCTVLRGVLYALKAQKRQGFENFRYLRTFFMKFPPKKRQIPSTCPLQESI